MTAPRGKALLATILFVVAVVLLAPFLLALALFLLVVGLLAGLYFYWRFRRALRAMRRAATRDLGEAVRQARQGRRTEARAGASDVLDADFKVEDGGPGAR